MEKEVDIVTHYQQYFSMVKAVTPQEKDLAYKLRHDVFHNDCGFHDLGNLSSELLEKDEYDDQAIHSLLFHKETDQAIGYIRLIIANGNYKNALPVETYYKRQFNLKSLAKKTIDHEKRCEISRMSLISSFRRRKADFYLKKDASDSIAESRRYPVNYLPICLIFAVMHSMQDEKMNYALAFVEKRLPLFLKHFGAQISQIGEPVECYGSRAPVILHLKESYDHLQQEYQKLYKFIGKELTPA